MTGPPGISRQGCSECSAKWSCSSAYRLAFMQDPAGLALGTRCGRAETARLHHGAQRVSASIPAEGGPRLGLARAQSGWNLSQGAVEPRRVELASAPARMDRWRSLD